ncbi:MAG: trehalose-phosphatase [Candidatus Eisenbacteria bacterium]|nr:trehalose-phosphatase [Candidatus Eisenbacteria bacterium]
MRNLSDTIRRIRVSAEEGHRLLVGLDFDGTLAPFVEHPHLARMDEHVRNAVETLARDPGARVAIVSSRGLHDLEERVGVAGVDLVASQGLELRVDDQELTLPSFGEVDPFWSAAIQGVLVDYPGSWLEIKPAALAVHLRNLRQGSRVELERRLRTLPGNPARAAAKSGWMRCRQTLEWAPAGAGKERGLRALLERWERSEYDILLYAGDDENDAEAMREVQVLGGIALGVGGDAPPEAEFHLADIGELATFLRLAAGGLRAHRACLRAPTVRRTEARHERPE